MAVVGEWVSKFRGILKDFKQLPVDCPDMAHGWIELVEAICASL